MTRAARTGLWRRRDGVVAVEFALTAPILLTMLIVTYDLMQMLITWRRMTAAASALVQITTSIAAQPNSTNVISGDDVETAVDAVFAYFPAWKAISPTSYGLSMTSVTFYPQDASCSTNCTYLAHTSWSASSRYGLPQRRPCGQMQAADGNATASMGTLPNAFFQSYGGAYGPPSVVVADITYQFTPVLAAGVIGPTTLHASAYLAPRIGGATQDTRYVPSSDLPPARDNTRTGYVQCTYS